MTSGRSSAATSSFRRSLRSLDALDGAAAGSVLQIAGEPGIGKSRLLRELAAGAATADTLVLAGRAAEFEAELPFGVFADALDDWLLAQPADRLAALAGGSAAELAVVLPAFEGLTDGRAPGLQQERYRAHRAVRHLLTALADARRRSSSSSTTCSGPIPGRSSCWRTCSPIPRAARCCSRSAFAPPSCRPSSASRWRPPCASGRPCAWTSRR